jgi:hypothetical protein
LSKRDRSLITVTALLTAGNTEQLTFPLAFAEQNGLTETDLKDAITHLAFYAGGSALSTTSPTMTGARPTRGSPARTSAATWPSSTRSGRSVPRSVPPRPRPLWPGS